MKKDRIPLSGPSGGLQNPFASLDLGPLPPGPEAVPEKVPTGRIVLRREKSGRGGKTVVVVSGFDPAIPEERIAELARAARQHCGCGGTLNGREIELQGDQPARVRAFFESSGFRVGGVS